MPQNKDSKKEDSSPRKGQPDSKGQQTKNAPKNPGSQENKKSASQGKSKN